MTSRRRHRLRRIAADRALRALVLAAALVPAMGSLRKRKTTGIYPDDFEVMRAGWRRCADMVVAGDSRILCGVSPKAMGAVLGDLRILNYAYGGNGYSRQYMQAVEDVLDPASRHRSIVLGISPTSLSARACRVNEFLQSRANLASRTSVEVHLPRLVRFFRPMSFSDAVYGAFPQLEKKRYFWHLTETGWIGCTQDPPQPTRTLADYRRRFQYPCVAPGVVRSMLLRVRTWTDRGITVYAVRPPTTAAMVALEDSASGFDERAFRADLRRAGGVWIDLPQSAYFSYDGSHLDRREAERMSRDLAIRIRAAQRREGGKG